MQGNKSLGIVETLFGFKGRIGRLAFFGYNLLIGFSAIALFFIAFSMVNRETTSVQLTGVSLIYAPWLLALWPGAALVSKRIHDLGHSAFHAIWITALWYLTPFLPNSLSLVLDWVGLLVGCGLLLLPGSGGPNRYGHKAGMVKLAQPVEISNSGRLAS